MVYTEKISELLEQSDDIQSFLDNAVVMIAKALDAAVCSIYLYNESASVLTLRATYGLDKSAVGKVQLKVGEGLIGRAFKELRPVCVSNASENPDYKYFSEVGEDGFDSFLVLPIIHGAEHIGVVALQREAERTFLDKDVKAALRMTEEFASGIETIRALFQIEYVPQNENLRHNDFRIRGHASSPGYAIASGVKFRRRPVEHILKYNLKDSNAHGSVQDLQDALAKTACQLQHLQKELGKKLPEVASLIFESHIMMLKDQTFTGSMLEKTRAGMPASRAVAEVAGQYIDMFEASTHDYMKEKARDVEDLALRLIANFSDDDKKDETDWKGQILIVRELFPSDILKITLQEVAGIIQVGGGLTSHIAILVRSLNIPMVIVQDYSLMRIPDGEKILLDAYCGDVYINPSDEVIEAFRDRERIRETVESQKTQMADKTVLQDGTPVMLLANINLLSEMDLVLNLKAEGVGLYRTEFPFLIRQTLPTEEEQAGVYKKLIDRMGDQSVTIRTLDAGGDKILSYFDDAGEPNPALGLRSTRLTLRYSEIFDQQIRAILRAGASASELRIMFPMIASIEELSAAKTRVLHACDELRSEGVVLNKTPRIGMMVELPAVLEIIDDLAQEADFFSIGTNDFIQYMLAVDRTNDRVAEYYCPHHPSVLRGLKRIADAAIRHNIPCAVCGEMAGDPRYIPFFIGIGVMRLSVDPHYLPEVQKSIMQLSLEDARHYAQQLLKTSSIKEIEKIIDAQQNRYK